MKVSKSERLSSQTEQHKQRQGLCSRPLPPLQAFPHHLSLPSISETLAPLFNPHMSTYLFKYTQTHTQSQNRSLRLHQILKNLDSLPRPSTPVPSLNPRPQLQLRLTCASLSLPQTSQPPRRSEPSARPLFSVASGAPLLIDVNTLWKKAQISPSTNHSGGSFVLQNQPHSVLGTLPSLGFE